MTPTERKLCRDLVVTLSGVRQISKEEFRRQFPSSIEGGKLASNLLEDAYATKNADDLRCVLTIGHVFGFAPGHMDLLNRLVDADWHVSHEDVVSALDGLHSAGAVDALYRATTWIPDYLKFDESRALAVKAIWALGKIPGTESEDRLLELARCNDPVLRKAAAEQLDRRMRIV